MNFRPDLVPLNDLPTVFAEADKYVTRYDFQGAIQLLQRAQKVHPSVDKALVKLGSLNASAYDFQAAQRYFEEGIRVSPTKAGALNAVGHHWLEVRNYEAATNCFERVLKQPEVPMVTFVRMAEIYMRRGRLDEAREIAERASKLYPGHEGSIIIRAKIYRQMKQFETADKLLRSMISSPKYGVEVRAAGWYELGAVLDQQGNFDEAMAAFVEAKTLLRLTGAKMLRILQMKQASMKEMQQVPKDIAQRWRKFGETELQPAHRMALLCGHARSGTTLLEYVIDAHPDVVSAEETSVFHNCAYYPLGKAVSSNTSFISALEWLSARNMRQIRKDYFRGIESFLGQPIGNRLLMDKNPANTFDLPSMARIFPETKFLVALRDPRDVCLSCFMQPVPLLPDTAAWLTLGGTMDHYAHIMGMWTAWKPVLGESAMEVRYEDMVQNLEGAARPALNFLGLPWDERVLRFDEHARGKIVLSPTYAEVSKPIFKSSVARWKNYQKYFEPHMGFLEPCLRAFGYE